MPTVTALVPMRHGSERVPNKNFRVFAGKPLYHHIIRTLLVCREVKEIVIDTDSPFILKDAARHFPGVRLIERPPDLRDGKIPMNEILLHDVQRVQSGFYLQTHSTNPLLRAATIQKALRMFFGSRDKFDSLFSVRRLQTRLWDVAGNPLNHRRGALLRTQDLPPVFEENSCMYLFSHEGLLKRRDRIGEKPMMFEMDALESMDINEEIDFRMAEALFKEAAAES